MDGCLSCSVCGWQDRAAAKECAKKHAQEMEALLTEGSMDMPEDGEFREDPLELTVVRLLCRGAHLFLAGIWMAGEGSPGQGDPPQPKFCAWEERCVRESRGRGGEER